MVSHSSISTFLLAGLVGLALFACGGEKSKEADGGGIVCAVGSVDCPCTGGGGCDPGLVCGEQSDVCEMAQECVCDVDETCTMSCGCDGDCDLEENCIVKQYDAYSQAGGPNCGFDGNNIAECLPGDVCLSDSLTCQVVHSGLDDIRCPGRPYDAYSQAGGPNCGSDGNNIAECKPGDRCVDGRECDVVGSGGGDLACGTQIYDAFTGAGGPNCGSDGNNIAECYGGDICEDSDGTCRFVHSPSGDNCPDLPYDAFTGAGGPNCGSDGNNIAECEPGDSCVSDGSCN